jgi:dynein heavy chain 1
MMVNESLLDTNMSGADSLPASGDPVSGVAPVLLVEASTLAKYIQRVVAALLEEHAPEALNRLLTDAEAHDKLQKFICDSQTKTLLIQRLQAKEEEEVGESSNDSDIVECTYSLVEEVVFGNPKITSIVLIKKSLYLEQDKSLHNQICEMKLSDSNPYETLHTYISSAVGPYFKSYVKETRRAER